MKILTFPNLFLLLLPTIALLSMAPRTAYAAVTDARPAQSAAPVLVHTTNTKVINAGSQGVADGKTRYNFEIQFIAYRCPNLFEGKYHAFWHAGECEADFYKYMNLGPASQAVEIPVTKAMTSTKGGGTNVRISGTGGATIYGGVFDTSSQTDVDSWTPADMTDSGVVPMYIIATTPGTRVLSTYVTWGLTVSSATVNFTAPPSAQPQPQSKPQPQPKSVAASQPAPGPAPSPVAVPVPTPAALAVPKPESLTVDGTVVDTAKTVNVPQDKALTLKGKTVPGGIVKLYIFSEPKTATVTADKQGNWAYDVRGLPAGGHHIESEVTDPATSKTSARETILQFSVVAAKKDSTRPIASSVATTSGRDSKTYQIVVWTVVLLVAATAVYVVRRRSFSHLKRSKK